MSPLRSFTSAPSPNFPLRLLLLGALTFTWAACTGKNAPPSSIRADRYSAVFLQNGLVVYGKLEGFGSQYPVLKNVFYIRNEAARDAAQPNLQLVKRGNEWHGPEEMVLNAQHILFVEPVGPSSKIATLINEAQPIK